MTASYDLTRFVTAQAPVIETVRRELSAGRKATHWMWFIFPQLAGLGRSPMAQRYAISSLAEAGAYLRHELLGPRLIDCTELVNAVAGRSVSAIFGAPDDLKFHSSMTLFAQVPNAPPPFSTALDRYFQGAPDKGTLHLLAGLERSV